MVGAGGSLGCQQEQLLQHCSWVSAGASVPRDPGRNHKFTRRPCLSSHTVSLLLHSVAQEQVMGPDSRRRGCTKHEPQEVWLMGAVFGDELP